MSFTDTTGATVTGVYAADVSDPITANERLVATVGQLVVSFSEDLNVTGGSSGVNSATNAANWKLLRNGVDISSQISDISFVFNNTTNRYEAILSLSTSLTGGDYSLTALSAITDLNGNALDGDGNGTPGGDFSQVFSIRTPVAQGSEFRVNTTTASTQYASTVAMDADGDFVVTWSSYLQDGSHYGIYAQRYNSAGVAVGSEFRVNTTTASTQRDSTVAMDADGDFVVTWSSAGQDGRGYGIYAQRYNSSGVAVGSEFRINTTTASEEFSSTVAMDADGDFVVTWTSFGPDGSGYGIYAQRYNSAGAAVGGEFRVNTTTANDQHYSTVAMDADGDFVVTWSSNLQDGSGWGIYAQRYNSSGVAVGGEFRVNTTTANDQHYSTVAMDADGDFVVTWSSNLQDGDGYGIYAQRYNSAGVAQGGEVLINSYTASTQRYSTVAMDADGDFVVDWQSNGIYAQVYKSTEAPATVGINNVSVFRDAPNTTIDLFAAFADSTDPDSNLTYSVVSNSQPSLFSGTTIDNSTGQLILDYNPNSFGSGNITLRATDTSGLFVETTFSVSVGSFASNGSEFGVNTTTANQQRSSTVAMDADGDFVVTWSSSGQDGGGYGIYAQRYNSAGVAVGSEFGVNTTTASTQYGSTVAMDADGDFVVTWNSYGQDGSGYGIYAQRYNSAGAAVGSEFRVNTTTASTQRYSTVAMDADGDFVVTWTSSGQDGDGDGIYAQRYNSSGVAVGGEFLVNTTTNDYQYASTVAMDADGDFIVTWNSYGQDGNGYGIYAQRYNSAGVAMGGEVLINSYTSDDQYGSSVAMDADGDFVVGWQSNGQDGSGYGIYAQSFDGNQIPTTTGINNVIVAEDAANTVIDLFAAFADNDADNTLSYSITGNTTSSLFSSTTIDQVTGQLVLDYANNANGSSDLTVRATDSRGLYTETTFNVNVTAVNDAPVLTTNNSLTLNERTDSTITNALLQTTDVEQTNEQLIYTLTDLPNYGTLQLNDGVNNVPLAVGQTFTQADINSGKVSYNHNGAETASDSFAFTVKDGAGGFISTRTFSINISAVDETINGTSGNDTINGLAGNDTINGLAGNDTINGGSGNDTINGGSGNDTLNGSSGNDTYIVDSSSDSISEIANEGIDTVQSAVSWTLGANLENLTLTGAAAINGTGNTLNNTLTG
ncbi:MAG: hypothetical protein KME08_18685, partial [Aphanothece sp. CMT-3BRIN-NPC111]|nr:hypothetical protein [Aphanothece sp. CMT-3BRIN-NPC111]